MPVNVDSTSMTGSELAELEDMRSSIVLLEKRIRSLSKIQSDQTYIDKCNEILEDFDDIDDVYKPLIEDLRDDVISQND